MKTFKAICKAARNYYEKGIFTSREEMQSFVYNRLAVRIND